MICPNQALVCEAKIRSGSTGEPLRWYSSQPAQCGPSTLQFWRVQSEVRMKAPLRVPTSTRTLLIDCVPAVEEGNQKRSRHHQHAIENHARRAIGCPFGRDLSARYYTGWAKASSMPF